MSVLFKIDRHCGGPFRRAANYLRLNASQLRGEAGMIPSWTHKTIFTYRGLLEFHAVHGLAPLEVRGAGFHPLFPVLGHLDPRHAHLLAVLATKN